MLRFRRMRSLQKFVAVHSSIQNHFNEARAPHQPGQFQGQPRRRFRRVASTLRGLTPSGFGQTESGLHLSDTTPPQAAF
jgi:hypothetical protein